MKISIEMDDLAWLLALTNLPALGVSERARHDALTLLLETEQDLMPWGEPLMLQEVEANNPIVFGMDLAGPLTDSTVIGKGKLTFEKIKQSDLEPVLIPVKHAFKSALLGELYGTGVKHSPLKLGGGFHHGGTVTGKLSGSDLNPQNLPKNVHFDLESGHQSPLHSEYLALLEKCGWVHDAIVHYPDEQSLLAELDSFKTEKSLSKPGVKLTQTGPESFVAPYTLPNFGGIAKNAKTAEQAIKELGDAIAHIKKVEENILLWGSNGKPPAKPAGKPGVIVEGANTDAEWLEHLQEKMLADMEPDPMTHGSPAEKAQYKFGGGKKAGWGHHGKKKGKH